jgi:hypothetical protein
MQKEKLVENKTVLVYQPPLMKNYDECAGAQNKERQRCKA